MKKTILFLFLVLNILINGQAFGQAVAAPDPFGPHLWTVSVKVIGEDGNPIAGADVSAQYNVPRPPDSGAPTYGEIKGLTDTNGTFSASHTDTSPDLGIVAEKSGYYATHIGQQFYYDDKRRNPTFTVLLKRIGKPISMYAKKVNLGMPAFDQPVGYDLTIGDWVGPYGKGISADIIFTGHFENQADSRSNYTLTVSFPNSGDGIQGYTRDWNQGVSGLISAHEAPSGDYQPTYEQIHMPNPDRIYYFRTHTKLDENGNVVSAHYGKIYGDFMQFAYYYNPTPNDRDVEFDPSKNLMPTGFADPIVSAP